MTYDREKIRKKYRDLFEHSLDFIYVSDLKGNFLDGNDIVLNTLGYEREELRNISIIDMLNKDQRKIAYERIQELVNEGRQTIRGEYKLKTKDGNFVYVETYDIPMRKKGKIYAFLGIGKNITERKITEQNLKDSEELFRVLYENTPFAILLINSKGLVMDCNPRAIEMFGYDKDEVVNKEFRNLEAIHPEDLPILIDLFEKLMNGKELHRVNIKLKKKDGNLVWTNIQANLVKVSEEKVAQVILYEHKESEIISKE